MEWASLTPKSLWQQIKADLKSYYDWETPCPESLDTTIDHFHLQKISLLRGFCIKTGIQILLREYNFENKNRATFFEEDILNIFPVVKHINPRVCNIFVIQRKSLTRLNLLSFRLSMRIISIQRVRVKYNKVI